MGLFSGLTAMYVRIASRFPRSILKLTLVTLLAMACIGCDTSLQPGEQVYALKNGTRNWKVPAAKPAVATQDRFATRESSEFDTIKKFLESDFSTEPQEVAVDKFSVDPPVLSAKRVRPDRTTETKVYITSKEWKSFQLSEVSCDLEGLTWQIEPADEASLSYLEAKSGWLLRAELPAGLEPGKLQGHSLTLSAQPKSNEHTDNAKAQEINIPIEAKVLRRLAAYGGEIDDTGTIHFGVQPTGIPHKKKLILKVFDSETELKLQDVVAKPSFVEVKMSPYGKGDDAKHLYSLEVTLPANAPEHTARKEQVGNILLKFDHPRIHELNLKVDFVLHGRATSWRMANVDEYR